MKLTPLLVLVLALAATAAGEEKTAPQPRVRLDAAGRAMSQPAPKLDPVVGPESAVMMERIVVRGHSLLLRQRPQEPAPAKGPFGLLNGGVMATRDLGAIRVDMGLWPHVSLIPWEPSTRPPGSLARIGFLNLQF